MEKQDLVAISDVKVSLRDHPQGHRGQTDDPCSDGYFGQDNQVVLAAVLFDGLALRGYAFLLFDAPAVPAVAPDAITGIEGTGSRCYLVHLPQNIPASS